MNETMFSKAKVKTKSNHEVLGLWQRSYRLHDVITFDLIDQTGIIKICLLPTYTPQSVAYKTKVSSHGKSWSIVQEDKNDKENIR